MNTKIRITKYTKEFIHVTTNRVGHDEFRYFFNGIREGCNATNLGNMMYSTLKEFVEITSREKVIYG